MKNRGFSLIEILVVIGIFAILATVASEATVLSLRGSRKSDSISDVRDNLDFAVSIIERSLRNAKDISSCSTPPAAPSIRYTDEFDRSSSFSCIDLDGNGFLEVASGSASLTSDNIQITNCEMTCVTPTNGSPQFVNISLTGVSRESQGVDISPVSVDTRINLRVY